VNFALWNQLVEMYERQMVHLLSHGVPIDVQAAAFEEAMRRVMKSQQLYVVKGGARSGRSLVLSSNGREVAQVLPLKIVRESAHPEPKRSTRDSRKLVRTLPVSARRRMLVINTAPSGKKP
jgi:hypothetical protein